MLCGTLGIQFSDTYSDIGHVKTRSIFDYEALAQIIADFSIRAMQGSQQQRVLLPGASFWFYAGAREA